MMNWESNVKDKWQADQAKQFLWRSWFKAVDLIKSSKENYTEKRYP